MCEGPIVLALQTFIFVGNLFLESQPYRAIRSSVNLIKLQNILSSKDIEGHLLTFWTFVGIMGYFEQLWTLNDNCGYF